MGKDLRGKELGVGISQRKDGMYTGRFTTKSGKRKQKYFHKLQECRAWMADAQFEDEHGDVFFSDSPTVDAWFNYWINEVKGDSIRIITERNYRSMWSFSISPIIGNMELKDVKPIHCQKVLNMMNEGHKTSTIKVHRDLMWSVFECAVENYLIERNPVRRNVKATGGKKTEAREALTVDEQKTFLKESEKSSFYNGYAFVLQTGIRVGDDDDKIRLNQRKPSKYKGLSRFGPEKNLQRINKYMKERPIFYKNLIQMKENFRFYLRCFYCITKVVILQFNSENRTELARNG